jgi:hypothetical protein
MKRAVVSLKSGAALTVFERHMCEKLEAEIEENWREYIHTCFFDVRTLGGDSIVITAEDDWDRFWEIESRQSISRPSPNPELGPECQVFLRLSLNTARLLQQSLETAIKDLEIEQKYMEIYSGAQV